ncbi:MAG: hypothetical protein HC835_02340 [Oscillatoriales cyanobacterium RM2_1_1]|nr:hypothetical protein [Oscillatoriales cyanobacterium SM2_3_0]NJO44554.1 hypothetical protein [Oscillatoriales cyanobacterium RM2_1_1]
MWRDELQSWLLARDSSSLIELFNNMQYEGHPGLWHICLYGLQHISHNPFIMQVFHLLISSLIVYLIVKYSPFSLFHRFLLTFSYFIFYEYTTISRNYNLGVLFIFLFCIVYSRYGAKKPILLATILALMGNTNIYALIVSSALSLVLIDHGIHQFKKKSYPWQIGASLTILILGWGISVLQIARPLIIKQHILEPLKLGAAEVQANPAFTDGIKQFLRAVTNIWVSYVPIPSSSGVEFWRSNILQTQDILLREVLVRGDKVILATIITMFASIFLIILCLRLLWRKPLVLGIYGFGTFSLITFSGLVFPGAVRHHGYLFILLIACLWIFESLSLKENFESNSKTSYKIIQQNQWRRKFLSIILSIQFLAGIHAYSVDSLYPFSMGKATAQFVQNSNLSHLKILGMDDRLTSVISGYLDKQLYYPEVDRFGSYWTGWGKNFDEQVFRQRTEMLIAQEPVGILMILTKPLNPSLFAESSIKVTEIKRLSQPSITPEESSYIIYLARNILNSNKK